MIQKCTLWKVFSVFCEEPNTIHYVKEISRKITLAPTSVRIHIEELLQENIIIKKKGERFFGFIAHRENANFFFYKRVYNLVCLKTSGLLEYVIDSMYPQVIIVYGSYAKGEDIEESDIDLFIGTKVKKKLDLERFEKGLKRRVHILSETNIQKVHTLLKGEIINGIVVYGYLKV